MWKIVVFIIQKAFNSKMRVKLEPCIKELYRMMANDNLTIKTEIVKVKKGTRRYDLAFFETPSGKIKFNLKRKLRFDFNDKFEIIGTLCS